ncbi:MAG TPA: A/G-specific adenine glycosylase [Terriglobales bacterium]|nr:A/G-specific adenine glycosylase [Terriglobales bacterium]
MQQLAAKRRSEISSFASRFGRLLLRWFDRNQRDLPWRQDRDPYHVWLSEIMLQQTRVAAVLEHYNRFLVRFPTLETLAAARLSSVVAAWSGLGYYRRAHRLHAAAREVVRRCRGRLPRTRSELEALPGIGRYSSAAIASIAFGEAVAAVDGNVERVLQRLLGRAIGGNPLWERAAELLSPNRPGDFNQAMMELGATLCLPREPKCRLCPVRGMCRTRGELKHSPPARRQAKKQVHYALDIRRGSIFLVRRTRETTLMPGMWELPEIPGELSSEPCFSLRHSITSTNYSVRVARVALSRETKGCWVKTSRAAKLPLTGLARKILCRANLI